MTVGRPSARLRTHGPEVSSAVGQRRLSVTSDAAMARSNSASSAAATRQTRLVSPSRRCGHRDRATDRPRRPGAGARRAFHGSAAANAFRMSWTRLSAVRPPCTPKTIASARRPWAARNSRRAAATSISPGPRRGRCTRRAGPASRGRCVAATPRECVADQPRGLDDAAKHRPLVVEDAVEADESRIPRPPATRPDGSRRIRVDSRSSGRRDSRASARA